jgi:hypothetical protein
LSLWKAYAAGVVTGDMHVRDVLRAPLVLVGLVVVVGALTSLDSLPPPPPNGRDIPGGFALIFLGLAVLVDVLVGVAVPGLVALLVTPIVLVVLCWRLGEVVVGLGPRVVTD